jgi:hypothetical protein
MRQTEHIILESDDRDIPALIYGAVEGMLS